MKKTLYSLILGSLTMLSHAYASDAVLAEEGRKQVGICLSCHAQDMDPPKAPPLWAVQKRYAKQYGKGSAFDQAVVDFVTAPTPEKALLQHAVEGMGLMNALPLPKDTLLAIAAYIRTTDFPPPCEHWRIGVRISEAKGDTEHAEQDRRKLQKLCQ